MNLYRWGLTERFEREAESYAGLHPARVTEQHRNHYKVVCEGGFLQAAVSGKMMYNAVEGSDFPAVGDWVMLEDVHEPAVIRHVLTRETVFMRKTAGTTRESQVVASNIDTVFICMALHADYNLRRLERCLSIAWDSGAAPVIVLTKSDLCEDVNLKLAEVSGVSFGADIIVCSKLKEDGYDAVSPYIKPGKTVAFIGSSGVGKSTMINHLLSSETQATREIREDGKGRHATTARQLMLLPRGGLVVDTPGMRELGTISVNMEKSFADIEALTSQCRFKDCAHGSEPGCAVRAAVASGALDAARFENYKKIRAESNYDGLSSRQIETEKINRMFGGKSEMKQTLREIKKKNQRT